MDASPAGRSVCIPIRHGLASILASATGGRVHARSRCISRCARLIDRDGEHQPQRRHPFTSVATRRAGSVPLPLPLPVLEQTRIRGPARSTSVLPAEESESDPTRVLSCQSATGRSCPADCALDSLRYHVGEILGTEIGIKSPVLEY
jgi:hypothetical protein